ncbi:MAG: dependent oxidoreductase [Chloroflexi bacterium]|nr:dependent oxidoreductase [Chloroflexota bacterium]
MPSYDVAIIGGGIVGLAAAREILQRAPQKRIVVLEKESSIGRHQTSHNSGVIHSGIYYTPGSLKARLCVTGSASLMRYCEEGGIPFERRGKVIVATHESELPRLAELHRRAMANGVSDVERIGPERIREIEPHAVGIQALWSPNTAVVDFARVAAVYADDVTSSGGEILTEREVRGMRSSATESVLETDGGDVAARFVVACAGLHADRVAAMSGASRSPHIVPFRGDYYVLRPEREHLVRGLIYPVPDPTFPFLGVHFTRHIDDEVSLGPNAVLAFARQGYRRTDFAPADLLKVLLLGGFRRLALRYWQVGVAEMWRDVNKSAFVKALQRYVPELQVSDVLPGPSGVRAQALSDDGKLLDDFVVNRIGNVLHVRNAPSPAATSSLAIGALIADALAAE